MGSPKRKTDLFLLFLLVLLCNLRRIFAVYLLNAILAHTHTHTLEIGQERERMRKKRDEQRDKKRPEIDERKVKRNFFPSD